MKNQNRDSEEFVDFVSMVKDDNTVVEPGTINQKEANKKRLVESFLPLIDSEIHTEITGEKIKIMVNKEDNTVKSIDIECKCGCKARLIFEYEG